MTTDSGADPTTLDPGERQSRALTVALITIAVGQLMLLVDATIVNVTLPNIQRALGFSGSGLEWVVTAYSLTFGGFLLLGGRAGDILGRRRVFLVGLTVFTLASLAGGFATEDWWLIVCRALQGIGGAAAAPTALSLIVSTFPEGPRRVRAISAYSSVTTAGGAIGLLAGGLISTYLSWRWVMFVNVPIGVFVIVVARRVLTETPRVRGRFDFAGAVTGTLGITLLVYGLITGSTDHSGVTHWADPAVLAALGSAAVLMTVFFFIETHVPNPLLRLRIFADRVRSGILVISVFGNTAMVGVFFFLTIFVQQVWKYSPLHTALVYIPLTVMIVVGIRLGGRLMPRFGARTLMIIGLGMTAGGMLWLSQIGDTGGYLNGMLAPSVVTYLGLGFYSVPQTVTVMAGVAPDEAGLVSGLLSTAGRVGGATGLAVLGTITWTTVASTAASLSGKGLSPDAVNEQALAAGVGRGFAVAGGLVVVSLLIAIAVVPRGRPEAAST